MKSDSCCECIHIGFWKQVNQQYCNHPDAGEKFPKENGCRGKSPCHKTCVEAFRGCKYFEVKEEQ